MTTNPYSELIQLIRSVCDIAVPAAELFDTNCLVGAVTQAVNNCMSCVCVGIDTSSTFNRITFDLARYSERER